MKILAVSKSSLEDVSPHFETHTKCWEVAWGGWLKRLAGERGTRFRWVLKVIDTLSTRILEVRLNREAIAREKEDSKAKLRRRTAPGDRDIEHLPC